MSTDDLLSFNAELSPGDTVDEVVEPQLKWAAVTVLERGLTALCAVILIAFTSAVGVDVVTRGLAAPIDWLQNFILGSFVWGIFLGAAVAQRRGAHFRLAAIAEHFTGLRRQLFETLDHGVVLAVALWMAYFGYRNMLTGLHNYLQPSEAPLAVVTAAIPVSGALIALFSVERLFHVWIRGPRLGPAPGTAGAARVGLPGRTDIDE